MGKGRGAKVSKKKMGCDPSNMSDADLRKVLQNGQAGEILKSMQDGSRFNNSEMQSAANDMDASLLDNAFSSDATVQKLRQVMNDPMQMMKMNEQRKSMVKGTRRRCKKCDKVYYTNENQSNCDQCLLIEEVPADLPVVSKKPHERKIHPKEKEPVSNPESSSQAAEKVSVDTCTCFVCGESASSVCSKCKGVRYCNVDHQRSDWSRHKLTCKPK